MNLQPLIRLCGNATAGLVLMLGLVQGRTSERLVSETVSFYDQIKPLFAIRCYKCHTGENPKGGLLLDSHEHALAGGKSAEAVITPGESDRSALVRRITSSDPDEQMPPKGPRLTEKEVLRIRQWID